jgi:hypothetical protein
MIVKNLNDVIGHKIVWHSWPKTGLYFVPDGIGIEDKRIYGVLYRLDGNSEQKDNFFLGNGIKYRSTKKEVGWWYLIEDLKIFKTSKLDDRLFEI